MGKLRIGDEGIFSHNIQCLDPAFMDRVGCFYKRQPWFVRQGNAPGFFELLLVLLDMHLLVSWIHVGKPAHIACALNIVLTPQRIDAAAGFTYLATQESEV